MAVRPVFVPRLEGPAGVIVQMTEFEWFPGMSAKQKQRSIQSLHQSAKEQSGISPILEISSKSEDQEGIQASAFNLMCKRPNGKRCPVENAFQAGKVFEGGGPYRDLLDVTPLEAKRDERLKASGNLISFELDGVSFPNLPRTLFYDWLYVNALHQNPSLAQKVSGYRGFTDIEYNPKKSLNCQAYSAALYSSIRFMGILDHALGSPDQFQDILRDEYHQKDFRIQIQYKMKLEP